MYKYKAILDENLDELTELVAKELGKNLDEARGDVLKAIEVVEVASGVPSLMQGSSRYPEATIRSCIVSRCACSPASLHTIFRP
jgi:acyl-CoA reductase-like NAD-dependent aldehyde dehydrogenase